MVFLGSTPIGGPIVGTISQHLGARYAIGLGAAGCFAAGIFGLLRRPVEGLVADDGYALDSALGG